MSLLPPGLTRLRLLSSSHPRNLLPPYYQPAISVKFATPEAFFPLRPTRAYGDQPVPARLYVTGYVRPETTASITSDMKVTHYWSHYDWRHMNAGEAEDVRDYASHDLARQYAGVAPLGDLRYTRIEINTAAKNYTDDLRFQPDPAPATLFAERLTAWLPSEEGSLLPLWMGASLLNALCSWLCAGFVGWRMFGRWRPMRPLASGMSAPSSP